MDPQVFEIVFPYWARAFAFTLALEVPLFVLVGWWLARGSERAPIWRLAVAGAAGTMMTHPLLWFVWPLIVHDYTAYIVSGELIVATVETFTFFAIARPIKLSHAVAASFIANAASYGLGMLL